MKWEKPSEELKIFLDARLKNIECESRIMFGCPSYFIDNNMFIGVFQKKIFIRLSPEDIEKTLKEYPNSHHFEPIEGKVMKEYLSLPENLHKKKNAFSDLLIKSIKYTRSLPPKKKRSKR